MNTTGRWISIGTGLAWAAFATGACGGNSNGPKDAGIDSPSYVTVTDASGSSSSSAAYTVPVNPLPGPVTVIDGSVATSSKTSSSTASSGSSSSDAGESDAPSASDATAD